MPNAGTVLLALLEHADADQLETLLEAPHLLVVLEGCGRDREALKNELAAGALPGTLLLELFEEGHRVEELIAMLPAGTLDSIKARSRERGDHHEAPVRRDEVDPLLALTELRRPVVIAWFAALTVPAMLASGVLPEWTIAPSTATLVALILAVLSGAFVARPARLRLAGMLAGLTGAPGAVWLSHFWLSQRDAALRLELVLAVALGALPGIAIFLVAYFAYERSKSR